MRRSMSGTLQTLPASRTPPAREIQPFAWQGWRMRVPASWNPVALEGDFAKGHALLAESGEPRLGIGIAVASAAYFVVMKLVIMPQL